MTDETGYRTLTGPDNPERRRYPVCLRVRFTAATVKQLLWQLRLAWRCGDKGRIRRLTALVGLAPPPLAGPAAQVAPRSESAREGGDHGRAGSGRLPDGVLERRPGARP